MKILNTYRKENQATWLLNILLLCSISVFGTYAGSSPSHIQQTMQTEEIYSFKSGLGRFIYSINKKRVCNEFESHFFLEAHTLRIYNNRIKVKIDCLTKEFYLMEQEDWFLKTMTTPRDFKESIFTPFAG